MGQIKFQQVKGRDEVAKARQWSAWRMFKGFWSLVMNQGFYTPSGVGEEKIIKTLYVDFDREMITTEKPFYDNHGDITLSVSVDKT